METTGSTHSGTGPSAEFRGKFKVEMSLKGCAHCLCLCVSTLPLVFKAWIKSFSPRHNTSVFFEQEIGIDWSNLRASVNFDLSGSGKLKEIDKLQRHNCAWSDSWNWLFFFLPAASRTHSKVKKEYERELSLMELYKPHQRKQSWVPGSALCAPKLVHSYLMKYDFKHTPFDDTSSDHARGFEMNGQTYKSFKGPWLHDGIAFIQDFYLYTEVYQDVNVGW